MKSKISIVFEDVTDFEEGKSQQFTVQLEGAAPERMGLPLEQNTAAEYHARQAFRAIAEMLQDQGLIQRVIDKRDQS